MQGVPTNVREASMSAPQQYAILLGLTIGTLGLVFSLYALARAIGRARPEPGQCPKCGMTLVLRSELAEGAEHGGHAQHGGHATHGYGAQGNGGGQVFSGHGAHGGDHGGSDIDHGSMDHGSMDHAGMGFMSMVEVTKDLPRSGDGLPMEWIDAPFGPFFPGMPGGLSLNLTLDGDTIARAEAAALPDRADLLPSGSMTPDAFAARLSGLVPLAPMSYALLAHRAIEAVAGIEVPDGTARSRIVALERERIASHLNWLALFGHQNGLEDLAMRAASLQLAVARADVAAIEERGPALRALCDRVRRVPLLRARLSGVGRLADADDLRGPVSRASGIAHFDELLNETVRKAPLRRTVDACEVGRVALVLASDYSSAITGEILYADAGFHIEGMVFH